MKAELKINYDDGEISEAIIRLTSDQTSINFSFDIPECPAPLSNLIRNMESGQKSNWVLASCNGDISIDTDQSQTKFHIGKYGGELGAEMTVCVDNSVVLDVLKELSQIIQKN